MAIKKKIIFEGNTYHLGNKDRVAAAAALQSTNVVVTKDFGSGSLSTAFTDAQDPPAAGHLSLSASSAPIFIADRDYDIVSVKEFHSVPAETKVTGTLRKWVSSDTSASFTNACGPHATATVLVSAGDGSENGFNLGGTKLTLTGSLTSTAADKKLATGDALAFCVGDLTKVQSYVGSVQVVLQATGRSVGHSAKNVDD